MDTIPRHCLENSIVFQRYDDMDLRMTSRGIATSFRFIEVPDIYTAGMKVEGLKIGAASLSSDHVLNIKLHEPTGSLSNVRNINFLIPPEADARQVSIEVFNDNEIFIRAPIMKKLS